MFVPIYIVGLILSYIFYRLEKNYTLGIEEINELKNLRSQKNIELEASILSQKTMYLPELKIKKLTHKI